jgi:hydrogenase maturation protein HypF
MADNAIGGPVIGVSFDGTGYGIDGNIWGGEFLVADYKGFTRKAYFEYLPLPGGPLAIRRPYRIAIGYLLSLGITPDPALPLFKNIEHNEIEIIKEQAQKGINSPLTSSCGRLFDAVAALSGVRGVIEYEAQAAIDLEMLATGESGETGLYPFSIIEQDNVHIIRLQDLLTAIIGDLNHVISKSIIAARFHNTVADIIMKTCRNISSETGIKKVALSGGVFQNRLLLSKTVPLLKSNGLEVYTHRQVPCNDGGISLGQAVIANFTSKT